jgi:16S rRNA G1207 methylase RsmC
MSGAPRSLDQRAADLAKDALYIGVGFGVLAIQRAQVQRRELLTAVDRHLGAGRSALSALARRQVQGLLRRSD